MSDNHSIDVKIVRLELSLEHLEKEQKEIKEKVTALENLHSEQVSILAKLSQTVDTLANTVKALNEITSELTTGHAVVKARFNWIIAILSVIGTAVVGVAVELITK